MQNLDWNDLRYVLTVAREQALAPAARALRVDATTISRRIARAELAMGAQLFHRTRGMLLPTEAGQLVVHHAEHIEAQIETLGEVAAGVDSRAAGSVRLTSNPWLINRLLVPAIGELKASHPMLRLELVAEPRNLSLTKREADLALRLGRPDKEQSVIARRIADMPFAVYGPSNRKSRSLQWIGPDNTLAHLPNAAWMTRTMQEERAGPPFLIANDLEVVLRAVCAGLGKSLLPCAIADREPGARRLGGRSPVLSRELWLLTHPDIKHFARIRAVAAWLETVAKRALSRK